MLRHGTVIFPYHSNDSDQPIWKKSFDRCRSVSIHTAATSQSGGAWGGGEGCVCVCVCGGGGGGGPGREGY